MHNQFRHSLSLASLQIVLALAVIANPMAHAQTFSVIHTFTGVDGQTPAAGVTYRAGTLYGTTAGGGSGYGTVYQIARVGNSWGYSPILLFDGLGGVAPVARVVFGPDYHLYGTTNQNFSGYGSLFGLIVPLTICRTANCFWKENVFHRFAGYPNDGTSPYYGDLVWDQQGNVYGTTRGGGLLDQGIVYSGPCLNGSCNVAPIYNFTLPPDGQLPLSGVVLDINGNAFGTTYYGGTAGYDYGYGIVYKLVQVGNQWQEAYTYVFQGGADGGNPVAGLTVDNSGVNLYGITSRGGVNGGGTIFELVPSGDSYTFNLIYSLAGAPDISCGAYASLTFDASYNNLYGTTNCGGANKLGNVFKLTKIGNNWVYTDLYDFTGGNDGSYPVSNVTIDPTDGKTLYGTASRGGAYGLGVVWTIQQ